jgi:RNA polymerase sigma-70 factor, ECF subfamily
LVSDTNRTGRLAVYRSVNGQLMATTLPVALPDDQADRLGALFDAHHDRLYRLARRLVRSADDARDLMQETFLKAARSPNAIPRGATSEAAWLVRVLINIRRDQWRKAAVRTRHDRELESPAGVDHGPEAALIARATVWRALDVLTPRRRAVIVMYELEGLSIAAIASSLAINAVTVRWHLAMGRRDLARMLKPQMGLPGRRRTAAKDGDADAERERPAS